ncbi:MAG: kelch repeat-containing protein [Candidatus Limnocylindrales bacterium]|jgi:hypothetical protein
MPEMTDEQLGEELRKALAAEAMSIEVTDAAGRVARVRARQARDRSRRPWALAGIAAALIVALVAGIGYVAWRSRPETGPGATALATPSATVTAEPSSTQAVTPASAGTFVPTGSMNVGRSGATATLLADGRVLIAGGWGSDSTPLASAELYDPATGTFSLIGSMSTARAALNGTATLLSDGRVLFAGGADDTGTIATAELFDPATGTFSPAGSMTTARDGQTATLLPNGLVLIAGGEGRDGMALASAELYDPATGKFTLTGSMAVARITQSATLLPNDRVLIAGGVTTTGTPAKGIEPSGPLTSAELYDPATGKFSPTGSMTTARGLPTTTLLADGRVLFAGGADHSGTSLLSAELYDPTTGQFNPTGSMTSSGYSGYKPAAALLSDGRVLIVGGGIPFTFLTTAQLYDPKTGTFGLTGSMSIGRSAATATLLQNGRVLIAGGVGVGNAALASAELYQP